MKLLVCSDGHLLRTPDGKVWCRSIYRYEFYKRYLDVFEDVRVFARCSDVDVVDEKFLRVDGDHVEVFPMPDYVGPVQLLKKCFAVSNAAKKALVGCSAALMRLPIASDAIVYRQLKGKLPLAAEVTYDPLSDTSPNGLVGKLAGKVFLFMTRKICREINGVSYVTAYTIQNHIPSYAKKCGETETHFEASYSTAMLLKTYFAGPRKFDGKRSFVIAHCNAAMNDYRKGEDIVLRVVKNLNDCGFDVSVNFVGDGTKRLEFEKMAFDLGIKPKVHFYGLLSKPEDVRNVLLNSDCFVFPTKAEGLPRGIIEAMAVGLPVLSTPVGGIPEIIDSQFLYAPTDVSAFTSQLKKWFDKPGSMNEVSERNFQKSLEFENEHLQKKRSSFYRKLRNLCV